RLLGGHGHRAGHNGQPVDLPQCADRLARLDPERRAGARLMTTKPRAGLLTTTEIYNLDAACRIFDEAFGDCPYLVGTAGLGGASGYRDVDVRLMLDDDEFAAVCP